MNNLYSSQSAKLPAFRKLRGYAFDPSLSLKLDTSAVNDLVYKVPWENVEPGPVGEYLEVLDYDPTTKEYYAPVNLDNAYVLAQDGLDPSESNPQFHQQMVYAVAMITIRHFEKSLGRKILWASRLLNYSEGKGYETYVKRLRIYPHALRDANAYYSPVKKAVLFGYFSAMPADETLQMPNSLVFTCLSHDIVAHEVTHALLDGMHRNYNEPSNADVLAFHEAFADIVALFQHFTFPDVLKHQIAKTRGDLASQNLLGQLAQQFGSSIGSYGSLRDALGHIDETTGKWVPTIPNVDDYRNIMEPHARGSILVAAVFEAFINIYKSRAADLLRIASNGTGILPLGELHPDLVNRLAGEAAKTAGHVLNMCIRALDYCPPVDITFGDYLRAIITADVELVADDSRDYRLAFIDAFRRRGIYPQGIKTLSIESLQQPMIDISFKATGKKLSFKDQSDQEKTQNDTGQLLLIIGTFLREYGNAIKYVSDREEIYDLTRLYIAGRTEKNKETQIQGLHDRLNIKFSSSKEFARITGLAFLEEYIDLGIKQSGKYLGPSFQIQNLRLVNRVGPEGNQINQVIFSIVQTSRLICRDGVFLPSSQKTEDETSFDFKGGCTLIFDLDSLQLKYAISKPLIDVDCFANQDKCLLNLQRLKAQYNFLNNDGGTDNGFQQGFSGPAFRSTEPFAFLHQH
ncbi:hypothetical protein SAMN05192574_101491 [Mucilaginibacter gossypiicola]|uniref:Peptidase M4 n=1 Tax=Mucilaginibacter gossypiicola TaxID=551995 RepID=A0A1H8AH55_9SPHI|nr:hypothetical protein [Mucilaginibacter gossypiicola]SEM69294.1 hypothetical protein SAMN05192574_101491 [Mucilaginibacter gossypiicola]